MRYSYILTLLLAGLISFGGCRERSVSRDLSEEEELQQDTSLVDIAIVLRQLPIERTKAFDIETGIANLNLFFVHESYPSAASPEIRHYYFEEVSEGAGIGSSLTLSNIRLGRYTLYAIANAGKSDSPIDHADLCEDPGCSANDGINDPSDVDASLCSITKDELQDLILRQKRGSTEDGVNETLLMTQVIEDLLITKTSGQRVALSLERRHAKVRLSYRLMQEAIDQGLKITDVTLLNQPTQISVFNGDKPLSTNLMNSAKSGSDVPEMEETEGQLLYYILENKQGNKAGDRTPQSAPKDATYFYLSGEYGIGSTGSQRIGFPVYLGDADQDNYDLVGNKEYYIDIEFRNANDPRVSTIAIETESGFNNLFPVAGATITAIIVVTYENCYNDELAFRSEANLVTGSPGTFTVSKEDTFGGGVYTPLVMDPGMPGNYPLIQTDGVNGSGKARIKVQYVNTDSGASARLSVAFQNKAGRMTILDKQVSIY